MVTLLLGLVALAIVSGLAVLLARDAPVLDDDPVATPPPAWPPAGPVTAEALGEVGFPVVLRGYRMDVVDRVLDDAATALAERDDRIAQLLRVVAAMGGTAPEVDVAPDVAPDVPTAEPDGAPGVRAPADVGADAGGDAP
ncbi:MAG: DivIVA domain-containing protein [Candidatus Nanopelagicales bacterium]|nr:DivIVA domain-containing protein [Candidatus Nanopelagicales bacterium]